MTRNERVGRSAGEGSNVPTWLTCGASRGRSASPSAVIHHNGGLQVLSALLSAVLRD